MKMDKLVRTEGLRKGMIYQVSIAWRGTPPAVANIVGVHTDAATAIDMSNDQQTHITQVPVSTPGTVGSDGQIWIAADNAGSFSAFVDEASARRHLSVSGGKMKQFTLNAGNKAAGPGGMEKAAVAAIKDALGKPLSAARAMWK